MPTRENQFGPRAKLPETRKRPNTRKTGFLPRSTCRHRSTERARLQRAPHKQTRGESMDGPTRRLRNDCPSRAATAWQQVEALHWLPDRWPANEASIEGSAPTLPPLAERCPNKTTAAVRALAALTGSADCGSPWSGACGTLSDLRQAHFQFPSDTLFWLQCTNLQGSELPLEGDLGSLGMR